MARLASAERMQFYPLANQDAEYIAQRLRATGAVRLLDPCAGEGEALYYLHRALAQDATVYSYAVELDQFRAEQCAKLPGITTLNSDWQQIVSSNKAIGLLYENPPYDEEAVAVDKEHRKSRMEWTFLKNTEDKLQDGGVLVYVVPMLILAKRSIAEHLAACFDNINIYSVAGDEFYRFKQVILFATKRAKRKEADAATVAMIMQAGAERPIPIDAAPIVMYTVPSVTIPEDKYTFRKKTVTRAEALALIAKYGAQLTREYQDLDNPNTDIQFRPMTPLKKGHIAAMIASGVTPVMNLEGEMLLRGASTKVAVAKDAEGNIVEEGRTDKNAKKEVQQFESNLYILTKDGEYRCINNDPAAFNDLMKDHAGQMLDNITERYHPLYMAPTPAEWEQTGKYMHGKRLPGMRTTGLLNAQRNIVIANTRALREYEHANDVCDMGTGKTGMAIATADMMNAWPVVVFGPGHMVEKWRDEVPLVVEGAKGFIARNIGDVNYFISNYKPGNKWVLIMGYEKAKLGAGPVAVTGTLPGKRLRITEALDEHQNVVGRTASLRPTCPKCGAFITIPKKDQARKCKAVVSSVTKPDGTKEEILCGEPLYQKSRYRRWPLADYIHKQANEFFKMLICDELHKSKSGNTDIARAFHQLNRSCKYTLNLTGTLFGGKSTDLFYLLHKLNKEVRADFGFKEATRWVETYGRLERTLVHSKDDDDGPTRHMSGAKVKAIAPKEKPGISPAVYQHLLKSTVFLRIQDLGYTLPPFEEEIVTLDMTEKQREQYDWFERSLYNTIVEGLTSFSAQDIKISRQLLSVWLTNALMRPDEAFRSTPILWKPPHDKEDKGYHTPWMIRAGQSENYGYTTSDDQARIDAGAIPIPLSPGNHRGYVQTKEVEDYGDSEVMHLYPTCHVDELLPKEEWLVEFCVREKKAKRKTIVGIQQTGTRDIQDRIKNLLARNGIKAEVLPDELKPEKRAAWIEQRAPFIDVLLTNPKKVETGLDLIQFANLIVYELPTSLFTLAQFVRRVWRLGQTQAVKTYYLIYRDSMQHRMLGLIAQKVMAASLLYGDDAGSAMAAEADDDDLNAALAKAVLNGIPIDTGIQAILSPTMQQAKVDDSTIDLDAEDAAALAASIDQEEQDDLLFAEDEEDENGNPLPPKETPISEPAAPHVGMTEAQEERDRAYNTDWMTLWADLAKAQKPAGKGKKKNKIDPVEQLDFFSMVAKSAPPAPERTKANTTFMSTPVFAGKGAQAALFN